MNTENLNYVTQLVPRLNALISERTAIKNAIVEKGVAVPDTARLEDFPTYIAQIIAGGGLSGWTSCTISGWIDALSDSDADIILQAATGYTMANAPASWSESITFTPVIIKRNSGAIGAMTNLSTDMDTNTLVMSVYQIDANLMEIPNVIVKKYGDISGKTWTNTTFHKYYSLSEQTTATAEQILSGYTAYDNTGYLLTGTLETGAGGLVGWTSYPTEYSYITGLQTSDYNGILEVATGHTLETLPIDIEVDGANRIQNIKKVVILNNSGYVLGTVDKILYNPSTKRLTIEIVGNTSSYSQRNITLTRKKSNNSWTSRMSYYYPLEQTSFSASDLAKNKTAYDGSGTKITGTMSILSMQEIAATSYEAGTHSLSFNRVSSAGSYMIVVMDTDGTYYGAGPADGENWGVFSNYNTSHIKKAIISATDDGSNISVSFQPTMTLNVRILCLAFPL